MPTPDLAEPTILDPHMRGDKFEYSNVLEGGYVSSNFDQLWFTLRTSTPASSNLRDADAVAQATMTGGGITFSSTTAFSVVFENTRSWPNKTMYWDLQGRLTNGDIKTLDIGELPMIGDITRSQ